MSARSTEQLIKDLRWLANVNRGITADRGWVRALALEAAAVLAAPVDVATAQQSVKPGWSKDYDHGPNY